MKRCVLRTSSLRVRAPGGRDLIRELNMSLHEGDRVAIVGRNGVGKSSLLRVLSGLDEPSLGTVHGFAPRVLVPQVPVDQGASPGEMQRRHLESAFRETRGTLLLDEPTHDLDSQGQRWLRGQIRRWDSTLLVVSHNRAVLEMFTDFFVVSETGCHHVSGTCEDLMDELETRARADNEKYVRDLLRFVHEQARLSRVAHRRQQKKNLGRIRELGRGPSRAALNSKRAYAQESQGKHAKELKRKLEVARHWAEAARRTLSVELDVDFGMKGARRSGNRLAITGPNGSGKSTWLREFVDGRCSEKTGYVAQHAANWRTTDSLAGLLVEQGMSFEEAALALREHRFPLGLAHRTLRSLSPGERLRAAIICIVNRDPLPDTLVLDEPTDHLDLLGLSALERFLVAWPGNLVVVSHDEGFKNRVGLPHEKRAYAPVRNHCPSDGGV